MRTQYFLGGAKQDSTKFTYFSDNSEAFLQKKIIIYKASLPIFCQYVLRETIRPPLGI